MPQTHLQQKVFFNFLVCWVDMTWNVCHVNKWRTFPWLWSYWVTRDKSSLQRKELTRMCYRHIATSRNRSLFQQSPLLKWKLRPIGVERKLIRMCVGKSQSTTTLILLPRQDTLHWRGLGWWEGHDCALMRGSYYHWFCDLIVIVSILITDILKTPSVTGGLQPKLAVLTGW